MPSYAQPIIGEWSLDGISVPLDNWRSVLPYKISPLWFLPKTDSLNLRGAYKWENCNPLFSLNSCAINPSSPVKFFKYLSNKLILHSWTSALNWAPLPGTLIAIVVLSILYPTPPSSTFTSINLPSEIIGVTTQPVPEPEIITSGGEL